MTHETAVSGERRWEEFRRTAFIKYTLKQLQRFVQQIGRTAQCDVELLHCFRPSSFLLERPKPSVLLIEDGLFGIQHEIIHCAHGIPPS